MNFKQAILTDNAISFTVFLSLMFQGKKMNLPFQMSFLHVPLIQPLNQLL